MTLTPASTHGVEGGWTRDDRFVPVFFANDRDYFRFELGRAAERVASWPSRQLAGASGEADPSGTEPRVPSAAYDGVEAMATTTPTRATEADLLAMPQDGRKYELVDGAIRVSPAGTRHGAVCVALLVRLAGFVEKRGLGPKPPTEEPAAATGKPDRPGPSSAYRPWAELLARSFAVDVLSCPSCRGRMRLLAMVKDPASSARFLAAVGAATELPRRSPGRGPPGPELVWFPRRPYDGKLMRRTRPWKRGSERRGSRHGSALR